MLRYGAFLVFAIIAEILKNTIEIMFFNATKKKLFEIFLN